MKTAIRVCSYCVLIGWCLISGSLRADNTLFENGLYFGVTEDPVSPFPSGQLSQLHQAGNTWVDVEFDWSSYETSQGQFSSSYVQQVQAAINAAITNGSQVGLRMSWQYTPTWATQIAGARFVDQYGDIYTNTPGSGMNVVAFTFNQNLRNIITNTMQKFFTALGASYLAKLNAIAFGGGFVGEVNLPNPSYNGHANCYWAYSSEAQTMFQTYLTSEYGSIGSLNSAWGSSYASFSAVSFTPGQSSNHHQAATDFLNWLSNAQQQYLLFQRGLLRNYFSGYLMLEMGGWGMRTNYVTGNIAVDLNGSGPGADSVSKVYDYPNFLKALSQAGDTKILADCTWIDPSLAFSGYGNPAPAGWIASLAALYNFKTCGEYTANSTALDQGATRILEYGLGLIFYVPESQLFAGSNPSVNDWSNMISHCQADFGAGVPYLISNDIGNVGTAGSDTISSSTITSLGAGAGCAAGASVDNFHYLAADLEGDGQLVINVESMSSSAAMQTGIMIRQSLASNDLYTAIFLGNNQCVMQSRQTVGGSAAVNYTVNGVSAPLWLKLQRTGNPNIFQVYYSSNGSTWNCVGSQTNTMAYASYIGVAVSSGSSSLNTSVLTTALTANTPPAITAQPQGQTVNQGDNVTFSVTAAETPPLSYQWKFNGANIAGANSSSYTELNVQPANAGNYSVLVSNNYGSAASSNAVLTVNTNSGGGQILWLNFNTTGQYTGNFSNPGNGGDSACTETNSGGVTNSGALRATGGDCNATYTNASWNFSANTAAISVSMMIKIKQATGTGDKIQFGLVNSNNAGFAGAASGDGWNFGSFRLLPQSTSTPTYQLAYQTATNGVTGGANVGSVIMLTVGHWYQFNTYFTNTGPGTSYNLACSLIDYGTDGATQGTNMLTFSTLETVTGTQAALSSDNTVWPCFRVANDTGVNLVDDFAVNVSDCETPPNSIIAPPQFNLPALSHGRLTLTWNASTQTTQAGAVTLLTATSLAGPWTVVTNAASPCTIPVDANTSQQFFKLEQ